MGWESDPTERGIAHAFAPDERTVVWVGGNTRNVSFKTARTASMDYQDLSQVNTATETHDISCF